jgi:hypothetical protein
LCLKPTSHILHYERYPELLSGVVVYEAKALSIFPLRTIIDPATHREIPHSHLQNEALSRHYKLEGKMPDDFHLKLVSAITNSQNLEPKTIRWLLESIGTL